MDEYKKIFNWLAENEKEDLTPSMLAHKASRLANMGYEVVDGELVAPDGTPLDEAPASGTNQRTGNIGFTDEDFEDLG